jgi:hypothetical protein
MQRRNLRKYELRRRKEEAAAVSGSAREVGGDALEKKLRLIIR